MACSNLSQFIPPSESIAIYSGNDFEIIITVNDSAGDPVDFTGATGAAQIRDLTGTLIDSFTVVTGGNDGLITLTLSDTQTAAIDPGFYKSDVKITDSGDVTTYIILVIQVVESITQ